MTRVGHVHRADSTMDVTVTEDRRGECHQPEIHSDEPLRRSSEEQRAAAQSAHVEPATDVQVSDGSER